MGYDMVGRQCRRLRRVGKPLGIRRHIQRADPLDAATGGTEMTDFDNDLDDAILLAGRAVIRACWIVGACIIAAIVWRVSMGAV